MPYPEFRAGQRITAALLNAGKMEFVTNSAGAQNSTSETLANVTDLVFAVEANARYWCMLELAFTCDVAGTDIAFAWTAPAGVTMGRNAICPATNSTTNITTDATFIRRGTGTEVNSSADSGVVNDFTVYQEMIDIQVGSTAGNIQLQFARNTASGTATVQADSMIWYQRVA